MERMSRCSSVVSVSSFGLAASSSSMKSPEFAVVGVADHGVDRDRLVRAALEVDEFLDAHAQLGGDLLRHRRTAEVDGQVTLGARDLVDELDGVHRDADRACLVGETTRDGLADPPGGVGRELVALREVELLDRTDEAEVAFLDDVHEGQATLRVPLGDAHDEAEVRGDHALLGALTVTDQPAEFTLQGLREALLGGELLFGEEPDLDAACDLRFFLGGEERETADVTEVVADLVDRGAANTGELLVGLDLGVEGGGGGLGGRGLRCRCLLGGGAAGGAGCSRCDRHGVSPCVRR